MNCNLCSLGIREDGSPCDCSFGQIQAKAIQRESRLVDGHGDPVPLDFIPERYRNNTTDDLLDLFDGESLKLAALLYVAKWVNLPWQEQRKRSLLLWGPVGTGKTTIATFALARIARNGHRGRIIGFHSFMNEIGSLGFTEGASEIENILKTPAVLIDDLGSQDRFDSRGMILPETSRRVDVIREIIDSRMKKGIPTIVTTNLNPDQVRIQFGDRVSSRLSEDFRSFEVNGSDIRQTYGVNHG